MFILVCLSHPFGSKLKPVEQNKKDNFTSQDLFTLVIYLFIYLFLAHVCAFFYYSSYETQMLPSIVLYYTTP